MNPKNFFRTTLSFLFALLFLYFAFRGVKLTDLLNSLRNVNYLWIVVLIPIAIISHWVRALRWKYLLLPIKAHISLRNLFSGVMIGYAINNVLPRVGEFVRPYTIGKLENISRSAAFATVVVERILDFMSFYFITCVVLFLYPHALDAFFENPEVMRPLFLVGSFAGLGFFLLLFFKAEAIFRFLAKIKYIIPRRYAGKLDTILESFYGGFGVVKMHDKFFIILLLSFLIWGLYALGMYEPFFIFDQLIQPHLDFGAAVLLLVVSSIAWVLPAPGAMGTYHSLLTIALVKLYNVDITTALSYSIVTHEIGYLIVMIIGIYYYIKDHVRVADISKDNTNNDSDLKKAL